MTIRIEALEFAAILGILDAERTAPQRVRVDTEISYDYRDGDFLDYARVAETIKEVVAKGRFGLVEEALAALFARLKADFPQISTIKITLCKPDILPDCRVCVEDRREYV